MFRVPMCKQPLTNQMFSNLYTWNFGYEKYGYEAPDFSKAGIPIIAMAAGSLERKCQICFCFVSMKRCTPPKKE